MLLFFRTPADFIHLCVHRSSIAVRNHHELPQIKDQLKVMALIWPNLTNKPKFSFNTKIDKIKNADFSL